MIDDLDRMLADDPPPPASPYFTAHVMRAVRAAAEPPARLSIWKQMPSLTLAVVGLAVAVCVDSALLIPAAAAMIVLAIWQARVAAVEFEH